MVLFSLNKKQSFKTFTIDFNSISTDGVECAAASSIIFVTDGSLNVQLGCNKYSVSENSIFIISPNDLVKFDSVDPSFKAHVLVLRRTIFNEILSRVDFYKLVILTKCRTCLLDETINCRSFLLNIYNNLNILQTLDCDQYLHEQLQCYVRSIFYFLFNYVKNAPSHHLFKYTRLEEHFKNFIILLADNYKISREVVFYSDLLNITPKYLNYICNSVANCRCKAIIDSYVVMQMKNELMLTDKSVQEIAYEYNFANQSFFGSYFKRFAKVSPSVFRNNMNEYEF